MADSFSGFPAVSGKFRLLLVPRSLNKLDQRSPNAESAEKPAPQAGWLTAWKIARYPGRTKFRSVHERPRPGRFDPPPCCLHLKWRLPHACTAFPALSGFFRFGRVLAP
jgi:hypothetical protein